MRASNMNSRVPEPISSTENHCPVEMESVLRIRPLLKKEREDVVLLEPQKTNIRNGPESVVLNPLHLSLSSPVAGSSIRNRAESDSTSNNVPAEYHFNHVLPDTTSQDKIYYTLGLPVVSETMSTLKAATTGRSYGIKKTKSHLMVCMGIANSGKTYTCIGGTTIQKRRAAQDGIVPRLLDSLFSQSKHHASDSSKGFSVQLTMIQITQPTGNGSVDSNACQIHDLLAFSRSKMADTSPKRKNNLTVRNMAARFERAIPSPVGKKALKGSTDETIVELDPENPKPMIESCRDVAQAREVLQNGLNASQKVAKGNHNFHLYITMQPVLEGVKYGDKISILDMAGLEKEKKSPTSRTRDNVSSLNQAASAAVLRCLRVMSHNTNVSNGKRNTIDVTCSDDEVSEISFVSQAKDPVKRHLKPVPFRQHKVTMLLNSLFLKSALVKVTLFLSAYPGHSDYQQKRMLLQDIELLHGSTLESSIERVSMQSDSTSSTELTVNKNDENVDDEEPAKTTRDKSPYAMKAHGGAQREIYKSVQNFHTKTPNAASNTEPVAPKMVRHYPVVKSKLLRAEPKIKNRLLTETEQAGREVRPSAPEMPQALSPKRIVSDFPGVNLSLSIEKNVSCTVSDNTTNKTEGNFLPTATFGLPRDENTPANGFTRVETQNPIIDKKKSIIRPDMNDKTPLRSPLGQSCLENVYDAESQTQKRSDLLPVKHLSSQQNSDKSCTQHSNAKTQEVSQEPNNEVKRLEKKLKESHMELQAIQRICAQLEKENSELKKAAREAGRKVLQSQWTDQDEKEFLESRRMRLEAQNLIKAPVHEHLKKVNYIYNIKNQWCLTNKRHFSLQFPDQFQRAPALDERDKAIKEAENEKQEKNESPAKSPAQIKHQAAIKGTRLSFSLGKARKSLSPVRKPIVEPPSGLLALKKLAVVRKTNY